jgi:predicted membrane-bound mannosyltransferase
MIKVPVAPIGVAVALALLGACSKPAETTSETASAAGDAASNAAGGVVAAGGAASPPSSPQNDAINTDANTADASQTPGSNSFTEGQARGHIENAGYTDVTGLTKSPEGLWTATAKKDGKSAQVSLDFKGAVTAK